MPPSAPSPRFLALVAVVAVGSIAARVASTRPDQALVAVAWTRHSAERVALCRQVYAQARSALDAALLAPPASAALEQSNLHDLQPLPPAIVTDIDETVLDNTPYNERLIADDRAYDPESWSAWVREAAAPAVPGAVAFLAYAASRGVVVFYVTNRGKSDEEATRANLVRLGLPLQDQSDLDVVLTKGEQPDWTSDKRTRRAFVARTHRILLMLGDDLGDFLSDVRPQLSRRRGDAAAAVRRQGAALQGERLARVNDLADRFGTRWFVLPNPMYGSWLESYEAATATDD